MRYTRACTDCNEVKSTSQFSWRSGKESRYRFSICKPCRVKRTKAWVEKNRERHNAYQREYEKKHRMKTKDCRECGSRFSYTGAKVRIRCSSCSKKRKEQVKSGILPKKA